MKKFCIILAALLLLAVTASAQTLQVTTPAELGAALADDSCDLIEITADMTITDSYVYLTKNTVILSDVIFQPAPDDGFFVKSIEIPEGITLTVKGSLTTVHTFENGFVIAQAYLSGGILDLTEGTVSEDCNICFNAGTLLPPAVGFGEGVSVARYLYNNVTEELIADALTVETLCSVTVQAECTVYGSITVPEGKLLQLSAMLTVADGGSVEGNIRLDEGVAILLQGSASACGITVPEGAQACLVTLAEDGINVEICEAKEAVK